MKNPSLRLAAAVILLGLWPVSGTSAFDFSELENAVTVYTLENGLKVLVMERHDAPVASFVTLTNVGGVDDPKEYTGLAHMLEHMAFKGTTTLGTTNIKEELAAMKAEDSLWYELRAERKKGAFADSTRLAELNGAFDAAIEKARGFVEPNAFDHILEKEGGVSINAGTSKDNTFYIVSLPSNRVELWMAMESERFLNPVFREMYRERNVIAEERRQTLDNEPIDRSIDALVSTAYKAHPYGIAIVGHMSDIENYTRDAVKEYFRKYYVPSNMIIAIVGDVKPKDIYNLAKKYWGRLPYSPPPEPLATTEPEQKGERRVSLEDPAQPFLAMGWHIPSSTDPDWPAVSALMSYLGEGRTSPLYKNLVKEKKIAAMVDVYTGYPADKYPSLGLAYAIPAAGHTPTECEEQILVEVERLKAELLPVEEVEKIRARAKAAFINGLNSNLGLAIRLAMYQNDWNDWRQLFRQLDRINAVTPEDIQRVAQKYFTGKNRTVVTLNTIES
ncbi:MAG: insulinase family protein [candidate division Zixibacteria bacterium]|nr:insulinase family protein [candidate division Zixibacteria bacterium]